MDDCKGSTTSPRGNPDFYSQLSEQEKQCFDEPGLLKRVRGKEHRARSVVGSFIENFAGYSADLTAAIQAQDYTEVQLHSHSIKGSAANLGAVKLSRVAAAIEEYARKQQNFNQLDDLLLELDSEFRHFKDLAQRRFGV